MKYVYLTSNTVYEIIPDSATPPEEWYGSDFAAQCREASDEVEQGWVYDLETGEFTPPAEPEPPAPSTMTTEEALVEAVADLMYEMDLLKLGLTEVIL